MTTTVMRRSALAVLVLAMSTLVACSSDDAAAPTATTVPTAESAATDAFPLTVEHKFGSTTLDAEPTRVVSVGFTEQDVLLQLGVVPVAVTDWYGDQPNAVWPWAQPLLGDATPEVLSTDDGFQYEKIAELAPDLIIGTNAGMTQEDYDRLSGIAPTVTSVEGSTTYFSSWQDQTRQIAKSVGRSAGGDRVVAEVEDAYAAAREQYPDFEGLSATFTQGEPYEGSLYTYPAGLNTDFLSELGFVITPGLEKFSPDPESQAIISAENVDLIGADVMLFATESQEGFDALQTFGTLPTLDAVQGNRVVYTDAELAGAIYFLTPLSQMYVLDNLTPLLDAAAKGQAPERFPG